MTVISIKDYILIERTDEQGQGQNSSNPKI